MNWVGKRRRLATNRRLQPAKRRIWPTTFPSRRRDDSLGSSFCSVRTGLWGTDALVLKIRIIDRLWKPELHRRELSPATELLWRPGSCRWEARRFPWREGERWEERESREERERERGVMFGIYWCLFWNLFLFVYFLR